MSDQLDWTACWPTSGALEAMGKSSEINLLRACLLPVAGLPDGVSGAHAILDPLLAPFALPLLSVDERIRVADMLRPQLKQRRIVAFALTRIWFADQLGVDPSELSLERSAGRAPRLLHPNAPHFSVAHSGDRLILAASNEYVVGVDVELCRERARLTALAEAVMTSTEKRAWDALPADRRLATFYAVWTAKEAMLKAHGLSLADGMAGMLVQVDPTGGIRAAQPLTSIWPLDGGAGYVATLALRSAEC